MMSRGVKKRSAGPPTCHEVCFDMGTSCRTRAANSGARFRRVAAAHAAAPAAKRLLRSCGHCADIAGAHGQHHIAVMQHLRRLSASSSMCSTNTGSTVRACAPRGKSRGRRRRRSALRPRHIPPSPAARRSRSGHGRNHRADRGCAYIDAAERPAPAGAPASLGAPPPGLPRLRSDGGRSRRRAAPGRPPIGSRPAAADADRCPGNSRAPAESPHPGTPSSVATATAASEFKHIVPAGQVDGERQGLAPGAQRLVARLQDRRAPR